MNPSRRVLGSPFKSPENVQNDSSTNIFVRGDDSSPTPLKTNVEPIEEVDEVEVSVKGDSVEGDSVKGDSNQEIGNKGEESGPTSKATSKATKATNTTPNAKSSTIDSILCPICEESMTNIFQLNQHVDDVHISGSSPVESSNKSLSLNKLFDNEFINNDIKKWFQTRDSTPQKRKSVNLDLFEGNKGFSLSDSGNGAEVNDTEVNDTEVNDTEINGSKYNSTSPHHYTPPGSAKKLSRSHWKQPSIDSYNVCGFPDCKKHLNIKNGIVNCRKCGDLFCNDHTNYKVKLRNPKDNNETIPQYDKFGLWSKCCERCYYEKPDLVRGTEVNYHDLTTTFKQLRSEKLEHHELARGKSVKKFIKLVGLIADYYLKQNNSFFNYYNDRYSLISKEREIIGQENWENDNHIHNCYICYTSFNFLIRKHHCRLCGKIVCDDKFGERKDCSLLIPIAILLEKLNYLNYSPLVKANFTKLIEVKDNLFTIRICKNCKNDLFYDYKLKNNHNNHHINDIFGLYNQLLILKLNINHLLPKYKGQISDVSLEHNENLHENLHQTLPQNLSNINKLKDKIMYYLKDFEKVLAAFKTRYFIGNNVNPDFASYAKLLKNIYQSVVGYLQEKLIEFKDLNNDFKLKENQAIPQQQQQPTTSPPPETPKLTKKQIREFREQLMVMNEQKFIIENLINETTKQRNFDELQPLINNKQEITNEIEILEQKLGDFGF